MIMLKKIVSYTTPLFFIITCGTFGLYNYLYYSTIPTYQKKLMIMVHDRADEINTYLNNQEKNAVQLSQETTMIDALKNKKIDEKIITTLLTAHKEIMGFKNIFLIDQQGTTVFSTADKIKSGTNVTQHTTSSLGKSYERAAMTLTNDFSNFNYNELLQEPALFITICNSGKCARARRLWNNNRLSRSKNCWCMAIYP